jgi:hypothetical protein
LKGLLLYRETERQRDRETERQRDRETERQRDRETERQRDRETERQRDRETERQRERETKRILVTCARVCVNIKVQRDLNDQCCLAWTCFVTFVYMVLIYSVLSHLCFFNINSCIFTGVQYMVACVCVLQFFLSF